MSRRESLVGGQVVAADAAEQDEKKRKQDEQRAAARAKSKRGGLCTVPFNQLTLPTYHSVYIAVAAQE